VQANGTDVFLKDVCFTDPNTGWAAGGDYSCLILHTTDGGNTWDQQSCPTSSRLKSVSFTDQNIGWAVGAGGTILHTINGGDTWEVQSGGTTNFLHGVCFTDPDNGWAVGNSGIILHTDNGGITGFERSQILNSKLQILNFPNPFSNEMTVTWNLTEAGYTKIEIYNSAGEKIIELFSKFLSEGKHVCHWEANDLPSGIYFIRLQIGKEIITKKIIKL